MPTYSLHAANHIAMTVEDTIRLTPEEIEHLSDEQKQQLPTIIEVLEYLSAIENANMRKNLRDGGGMQDMFREGKYIEVSDQAWTNIPKLYPCSQSTFTLMRGQSDYHKMCYPSLYRPQMKMTDADSFLISRLQASEFIAVMVAHPVVQALNRICKVEFMAVAQHYGFPTEYIDITNQKWVAVFFACTKYINGTYIPYNPGKEKKIGVVYVENLSVGSMSPSNVKALGFHYFERPTRQNAMVYQMKKGENFDLEPFFRRIVFRHDAAASKFVYKMAYNQLRYFPKDCWADIANQIRKSDYPLSKSAIDISRHFGVTQTDDEIYDILRQYKMAYTDDIMPQVMPDKKLIDWECKVWNEYTYPHLQRSVLPTIPVYPLAALRKEAL